MKINIATDSTIETVSKETFADGKYKFIIKTWCDNIVGCTPDGYNSAIYFNDYFNSVVVK